MNPWPPPMALERRLLQPVVRLNRANTLGNGAFRSSCVRTVAGMAGRVERARQAASSE